MSYINVVVVPECSDGTGVLLFNVLLNFYFIVSKKKKINHTHIRACNINKYKIILINNNNNNNE